MASVNQTRPHYVNQMGKTHSKPLAAQHGRGKAWARHGNGMLCVNWGVHCGSELKDWGAVPASQAGCVGAHQTIHSYSMLMTSAPLRLLFEARCHRLPSFRCVLYENAFNITSFVPYTIYSTRIYNCHAL